MENKQTAVDWLFAQIFKDINTEFVDRLKSKAKSMEKEQIKDAFVECYKANVPDGFKCKLDAEQYYNETYGK